MKYYVGTSSFSSHYMTVIPENDSRLYSGIPSDSLEFNSEEEAWEFIDSCRETAVCLGF